MHSAQEHSTMTHNATGKENNLTVAQLKALGPLASGVAISRVAEAAGVDRTTVYRWLREDAAFVAEFNRHKEESLDAIQTQLRSMAQLAVGVLRSILEDDKAPATVRLRTALAVLGSVGGIQSPEIGETDVRDIEHAWTLGRERQFRELKDTLNT